LGLTEFLASVIGEAAMNILCVDAARFGAEDLDARRRFLRDLGVAEAEAAVDRSLFRAPEISKPTGILIGQPLASSRSALCGRGSS
jgi:hypothetical protein